MNRLNFAVIVVGFSSILTQIVVLREALSGFYGNELVLGVILGNWLLLSGIGSILGRRMEDIKNKLRVLAVSQLGVAALTLPTVFLIKVIRMYITTPGEFVGFPPHVSLSSDRRAILS
jgi:spermidine synthase